MQNPFSNFYRNFYLRTGGFIPTKPLDYAIYPGDFFQIINGEIIVLGNVFRKGILSPDECRIETGIKLNPVNWTFSDGLSKPYSGRAKSHGTYEFSKQILAFLSPGSFCFRASNPEAVKITNWSDIQRQLIIRMTQTFYSFRELYIVTEIVTTSDWTLAIAGSDKAELEIATEIENFGLVDIFGQPDVKTIQSKDMEYYHRETKRKPCFFTAKKLVVNNDKNEKFISEFLHQREMRHEWASNFFDYEFYEEPGYRDIKTNSLQIPILDLLRANELNPNTALEYFKWIDLNLDDVAKLFVSYGD